MDARLLDIPDGRLLDDVPHLEPLDGLVLRQGDDPRTNESAKPKPQISRNSNNTLNDNNKSARESESANLGAALGAVGAADVLHMAAAMLVAAAVPALEGLRRCSKKRGQFSAGSRKAI
jgi:hypothetical protein